MSLFWKECRHLLKSVTYYMFIAVVALFYFTQMGGTTSDMVGSAGTAHPGNPLVRPQKAIEGQSPEVKEKADQPIRMMGSKDTANAPYGMKESMEPAVVMPSAAISLLREYQDKSYQTYPYITVKYVKLDEKETRTIEAILTELSGMSMEKLNAAWDNGSLESFPLSDRLTFDRFKALMDEADTILGGGSKYSDKYIQEFGRIPVTYEEALAEYENSVVKEKITPGFARLLSDYVGIAVAIFPVFLAVFAFMKDKRSRMQELIYSRGISSVKWILSRYFALVFMMLVPILLLSLESLIPLIGYADKQNLSIDSLAFVKYILWWILPTIMIVTAVGMILTVLTDTPIAIVVQLFWWFYALSAAGLSGKYPLFGLLIRHNSLQDSLVITEQFSAIMANRVVMTGIALLLAACTICIYEQKRRGNLDLGSKMSKRWRVNQNKLQADHIQ